MVRTHEHLLCSALQFKTWYELLVCEVRYVGEEEDVLKDKEIKSERVTVF